MDELRQLKFATLADVVLDTETLLSQGYDRRGEWSLGQICQHLMLVQDPSVDGYVWLSNQDHPGLGKNLYDAMNQQIPVIGVAKNPFKGSDHAHELCRGSSDRPLYITSIGIPTEEAASNIAAMHGPHRFPSILKRVDRLSRGDSPTPKER